MRRLAMGLLALAAVLALPAAATANPAYEPNNGIHQAFGPLSSGANYDGVISSDNDEDWYVLYASGQGVLDASIQNTADPDRQGTVYLELLNQDGEELNETFAYDEESGEIVYTTPGPGQYYLVVDGSGVPNRYRLNATGPLTGGPRPGPVDEVTPNNNQERVQAYGPLAGDRVYGGSLDANGEYDWFYFYTAGPGSFQVALTNEPDNSGGTTYAELYDAEGIELAETFAYENRVGRINYTAAGAQGFFLLLDSGSNGDIYRFHVTPASLLTPNQPAALSEACQKAEAKLAKKKEKLQQAKFDKQNAFSKKERKKANKKVKKKRKQVKKAKKKVKKFC